MAESGGSVWGRVLDRTGCPVALGVIYWLDPRPGDGPVLPKLRFFPYATTDAEGGFWASDLPPGPCILVPDRENLCVSMDGGKWEHGTKLNLPVPREPETVLRFPHMPVDFSRLRGTLSLPDTRPARNWTVGLFHPDRPHPIQTAKTNKEGKFEMGRVPPGEYMVKFNGSADVADAQSPVTLHGGKIGTITVPLPARPPGPRHSGRVVCVDENGIPMEGVLVNISCMNTNAIAVRSGSDGVALAEGLPSPPIVAVGNLEGRFPSGGPFSTEEGEIPEALLTMRPMHILQMEVSDASNGELIPRYSVHLRHEGGMAADESGPVPRGVRGRGVMQHGKLEAIPGPCKVQVEAPGFEGVEFEVIIPPEGPAGPVKVRLQPRNPS